MFLSLMKSYDGTKLEPEVLTARIDSRNLFGVFGKQIARFCWPNGGFNRRVTSNGGMRMLNLVIKLEEQYGSVENHKGQDTC